MAEELTAVDYLEQQHELEREARELMPYDPDSCTYPKVLRQVVFACLTCLRANNKTAIGVCYLCLIQCHLTHELVELFSKREFVCDCGTTKMEKGNACKLRIRDARRSLIGTAPATFRIRTGSILEHQPLTNFDTFPSSDTPAEDIPSLGNEYNHNFTGHFCSCDMLYNPIQETRTMHQCYFGVVCGEDWFHQDCILGYKPGSLTKGVKSEVETEVKPKTEESETPQEAGETSFVAESDEDNVPHFPELSQFSEFICWRCVAQYQTAFDEFPGSAVHARLPHLNNIESAEEWKKQYDVFSSDEPPLKKRQDQKPRHYSLFLKDMFRVDLLKIKEAAQDTALGRLLLNNEFLYEDDPVYQPPEEAGSPASSTGSLFEMGTNALLSLPAPQAIEGLQAYGQMKSKLKDFFQSFVEQGKVVTEDEVREFFGNMKK